MQVLTPSQSDAIKARGNVLVLAGAGTGKTRTLVERCVQWILDKEERGSLDRVLMVTFTEAAAAEIRGRIRGVLEQRLVTESPNERVEMQLALLDSAYIGTLHSICLRLIRQYFHVLEIDPQVAVLGEEEGRLLRDDTLESYLQEHYSEQHPLSEAVVELIESDMGGDERILRKLVLRIYHYAQSLPFPDHWFQRSRRLLKSAGGQTCLEWLLTYINTWRTEWLEALEQMNPENENARACQKILDELSGTVSRQRLAHALEQVLQHDANWPHRKKTLFREPLRELFAEAQFLSTLVKQPGDVDPIDEDWNWTSKAMLTLLELSYEFGVRFANAKRELGIVDFNDIEQFALKLLKHPDNKSYTAIAKIWRKQFELQFVDEYQDINAVQDAILSALARDGIEANRYLVGDIKQSIYRFRLADPSIFQEYAYKWQEHVENARVIFLSENFRSHAHILQFVNEIFSRLMRKEVGGVEYDEQAQLKFGASSGQRDIKASGAKGSNSQARVEFHLQLSGNSTLGASSDAKEIQGLNNVEKEARLIARRLLELRQSGYLVHSDKESRLRPVDWRDMVILLRSPRHKITTYAKEFARLNIPLDATQSSFFESLEVTDWLNLLKLLDNPLQDEPTVAVLRSPLVGLSLGELALVRLAKRKVKFWEALQQFHANHKHIFNSESIAACGMVEDDEEKLLVKRDSLRSTWEKVDCFLATYLRWRQYIQQFSLAHCLEMMLAESSYLDWLLGQARGEQRRANIEWLLKMTRKFIQFQRQGLQRFIQFIEAQRLAEIEQSPLSPDAENAVKLMSIHQSKGLEFPIVVVADLGKNFNFEDIKSPIIIDEEYGLCSMAQAPHKRQRYPSLAYWLAQRRQEREILGEELRILYVALTRACESLILVGCATKTAIEKGWEDNQATPIVQRKFLTCKNYLAWLGLCLPGMTGNSNWTESGRGFGAKIVWNVHDSDGYDIEDSSMPSVIETGLFEDNDLTRALCQRVSWRYPHLSATLEPAKTSVTALRRYSALNVSEESYYLEFNDLQDSDRKQSPTEALSAAERGTAYHVYMQHVDVRQTTSMAEIIKEAQRLEQFDVLSAAQVKALDFEAIFDFWISDLGAQLRVSGVQTYRELPFTIRIATNELAALGLLERFQNIDQEFIILQGVVDLALVLANEIWIIDFKTDRMALTELPAKVNSYTPQLKLYALALSRIYRRPVTRLYLHFFALRQTVQPEFP
jgi:ATP-dependent helicase/nuclease subunit A